MLLLLCGVVCMIIHHTLSRISRIPERRTDRQTDTRQLTPFVSDIAIFVMKRDVKLQLTN